MTVAFSGQTFAAKGGKFVVGLPMVAGIDSQSGISDLLDQFVATLAKKMGVQAEIMKIHYKDGDNILKLALAKVDSGEIDMLYLYGLVYAEYLRTGRKDLNPVFVMSMTKHTVLPSCIFVRKGTFKKVADLRGKRWAGSNLVPARYLLYKSGIDEPLDKFFGSATYASDSPVTNIIAGLDAGKYDAFTTFDSTIRITGLLTKKNISFEPLYCEDYDYNWIFLAKKDLPPDFTDNLRKIMLKSDKDPDFAKFQFAFKMVDGKFLPFNEEDFGKVKKINDLIVKEGWREEEKAFYKKYGPKR
jgi:ABC-type phosphate/phosphonate transport system substrate-binding protein